MCKNPTGCANEAKSDAFEKPGRFSSGHFQDEISGRAAFLHSGFHSVEFDANGLPSGTYLYRLQVGSFVACRKMIQTINSVFAGRLPLDR